MHTNGVACLARRYFRWALAAGRDPRPRPGPGALPAMRPSDDGPRFLTGVRLSSCGPRPLDKSRPGAVKGRCRAALCSAVLSDSGLSGNFTSGPRLSQRGASKSGRNSFKVSARSVAASCMPHWANFMTFSATRRVASSSRTLRPRSSQTLSPLATSRIMSDETLARGSNPQLCSCRPAKCRRVTSWHQVIDATLGMREATMGFLPIRVGLRRHRGQQRQNAHYSK